MSVLWRGNWATRIRVASGLVLFAYVLLHFLNIGLGLISPDLMDRAQGWRQMVSRSLAGTVLLYGSLLAHAGLALQRLALRQTLRMPRWEALQLALGLAIPLLLAAHLVHTRMAHELFAVNDRMAYIITLLWGTPDGAKQAILLLVVWLHGCIGLHFWLRLTKWWQSATPYLVGLAVLVPAFALAGFMTEGRRVRAAFADAETRAAMMQGFNWPDREAFAELAVLSDWSARGFVAILAVLALIYAARRFTTGRKSVRIRYVDGPEVSSPKGMTLLEMSRASGVPHTALCGGRGRCTTCRVIVEDGAELLHPPSEAELKSLRAVNAPPNARLACQIRPTSPATVFRVFRPDGKRGRAHATQGQERRLALLFLDMRGFTARTTGQLPYDVVFLLNRFFDAVVPPVRQSGGAVDKYLGDGLLAVFETKDEASSARAAMRAAAEIGRALDRFNRTLAAEGAPEVRIGMGLHLGNLVLGEIGSSGDAPRTIIGDTVNAASRLEGKCKDLGVELLISQSLLESAGLDSSRLTLVGVELRGLAEPMSALAVPRAAELDAALAPARAKAPAETAE